MWDRANRYPHEPWMLHNGKECQFPDHLKDQSLLKTIKTSFISKWNWKFQFRSNLLIKDDSRPSYAPSYHKNLIYAFFYSVPFIPLSTYSFLHPPTLEHEIPYFSTCFTQFLNGHRRESYIIENIANNQPFIFWCFINSTTFTFLKSTTLVSLQDYWRIIAKHYLKRTASAQLHTALKTDNSPDGDSSERLTNFFKVSILIVVSAENINSYPIASKKT